MERTPLYVVDIIGEVVQAMDKVLFPVIKKHILYEYGRSIQILQVLQTLNGGTSPATKNGKFPLFALFQDFPETNNTMYYATIRFPKISIATLTTWTDPVKKRYDVTFKPILYPIYNEFFNQLANHPNVVSTGDPDGFNHVHWDRPGHTPEIDPKTKTGLNEYLDIIEIQNLEVTFKRVNHC